MTMPTTNENIFNQQIRHAIDIEGFKNGLSRRTVDKLDSLGKELQTFLYKRIGNVTQRGFGLSKTTEKRINAIIDSLTEKRQKALGGVFNELDRELSLFATLEVGFQMDLLNDAVPATVEFQVGKPAQAQIDAATKRRPFNGRFLREWYSDVAVADRKRLRDAIRVGYQEGLTTDEIVQSIMGTKRNNFTDGILNRTRNEIKMVARTATNHYANGARQSVFEENQEIISGLRWTATLDGRTSLICASRDGEVWDIDKGPRPPAHPNCRSIMVAVIDGVEVAGRRPYVSDTRTRKEREQDFRQDARSRLGDSNWSQLNGKQRNDEIRKERANWSAKNIGQVNSKTDYDKWLRSQSAAFQDQYLGKTKGKLFRQGEMKVDQFVSPSGHEYTIKELEKRNKKAFRKAGLK